ncbi:MAG: histidine--tRNA ligase [Thermodesulfobacteriota bacterium]
MEFSSLKGFRDILPEEVGGWQRLETAARRRFEVFGFQEIKTPVLERTELFSRGIGQDTDIVSKEMYSFQDVKGRGMTMRPEATASVVRAYIQHRLYENYPVQKLYSIGPMFRHERPQKGRFRQFHQINAELFADPGPRSDAEIILMAVGLFEAMGLDEVSLHLNSLGCARCRSPFREALHAYLTDKTASLCPDCRRRTRTNPLRVFDCKMTSCKEVVGNAPSILEFLCQECRTHFDAVKDYLAQIGVPFVLNPQLVRGLDYYNRTTFEIQTLHLGAQNAVAGGGRYDGLVKLLGGPDHPAIGFAVGMERVVALLEAAGRPEPKCPDLFIAALGQRADRASFTWMEDLRKQGFWVETDYGLKGLKSQMKKAGRLNTGKVLIVGDDELNAGEGVLRDMVSKEQIKVDLDQLVHTLAQKHLK